MKRTLSAWMLTACSMLISAHAAAAVINITTLSTRADRVSGGDVLVQINQTDNAATPSRPHFAQARRRTRASGS